MDLDLSGKVALVTGSTASIGLPIATGLAEASAHVWVNGLLAVVTARQKAAKTERRSGFPSASALESTFGQLPLRWLKHDGARLCPESGRHAMGANLECRQTRQARKKIDNRAGGR
jgi:NAD(P)-dependent dehydrogenase (short-subunit alcohol dehydrogenase family)